MIDDIIEVFFAVTMLMLFCGLVCCIYGILMCLGGCAMGWPLHEFCSVVPTRH